LNALTCGKLRSYLESVKEGRAPEPDPELWRALHDRGAINGDPVRPRLTPIGEHTLRELALRAYRVDRLPVSAVEEELTRTLQEMDQIAQNTEYFLSELGPITPNEALPLLRPVAVSLANRRRAPEDLAEAFRQVWGSMEVMGGNSYDRLLAAELLCASAIPLDRIYAQVVDLSERLKEVLGPRGPSNTCATILTVGHPEDPMGAYRAFLALRSETPTDEAAALLAAAGNVAERMKTRRAHFEMLKGLSKDRLDAELAATFLALADLPAGGIEVPIQELARTMARHFRNALTPSAILAARSTLSPDELSDWLTKATTMVQARQLAPTQPELDALALFLVHGLHQTAFLTEESAETKSAEALLPESTDLATMVALHAWIYRPLVATLGRTQAIVRPA
jgi:hypothetical protein